LEKIWKLKKLNNEDGVEHKKNIENFITTMRSLRTNVQLPDIILKLLYYRGITDYVKVLRFFRPSLSKLYDPFLLKDCDKAVKRILDAVNSGEKIMIIGDYDVDGTCGASMFYLFLKKLGAEAEVYIPDRIIEGYGISFLSIDEAEKKNVSLIVSIDCGITAFDKVNYAKEKNIDFIICDHHQPPEEIPEAFAVLDPLRKDCSYPYKYLCGAGVAFKLAQAIAIKTGKPDLPNSLIDLVAIATASDIVPITDENRIIVNEGFELINSSPRACIKIMLETSGLKPGSLSTSNVVFTLAPRINAVGRLGDAMRAVELLTCEDDSKIKEFAYILNSENLNRRELDKVITDDAYKICDEEIVKTQKHSLVIHNESWHPGVIGIVAARLVEKYNIPSIVLTTVNGVAKGSARSIHAFNIYEALKKCESSLIQYGGHYHAAGLEIHLDKIDEFKKRFDEIALNELTLEQLQPEIECDAEITFEELTEPFAKILFFFEPFGPENMTPVFITKNLQVVGEIKYARANTHIFKLRCPESKKYFEAVFFNSEAYRDRIKTGATCDICYSVDRNEWKGFTKTKLRIRDMKFH
jgi:single-stranded-DNA-specific exonuclease